MAAEEGIAVTGEQITTTREPREHYIRQWGASEHVSALADGTPVAVWQGQETPSVSPTSAGSAPPSRSKVAGVPFAVHDWHTRAP